MAGRLGQGLGVVFRVTSAELWLAGRPGQGHQGSLAVPGNSSAASSHRAGTAESW